jgi:hypothetical protein
MTRRCELCGQPIKNLRSAATKTMHAYCQTVARASAGGGAAARPVPAAKPQTASVATFAVASLDADLPIEPEKEAPVAKQTGAAKVVDIGKQPTAEQVQQIASEYEMYKLEAERVAAELAKRGEFLKRVLVHFPGQRVAVGEQFLGRIVSVSEKFDLDAAKKNKALRPMLKHYTEVIENFDLKAARNHLDEGTLAKYVIARETVSLRFLKSGEE